ncbi:zinc-binding dehydrogenase [Nocardioides convexus]|uniref:zinc-binding dehydrogenase n=1 Tax=Nocardioides convexus TaxID=2712224 RepID=UPI0024186A86|nr:zinc-binding dehydrogenase [Nocardioides convexus]
MSMRALVQHSSDGPADLALVMEYPEPAAGPGEYLVRVGAAGVNFADVLQTRGRYGGGPTPPYVAGFEAAGEIVAVGPGVTDPLPLGTHVLGTGPGAFAEHVAMPAAAALPVPAGWSDAQALGLVLNTATALAALRTLGRVRAGETVLVHAAAGGVGQAAVRLARHYGARVVATASPGKHEVVAALGADVVLDARRPDLAEEVRRRTGGVDVVLESVGRTTLAGSLALARPFTGRVVVFGAASGDATVSTHDLVHTHPVQVLGLHVGALAGVPEPWRPLLAGSPGTRRRRRGPAGHARGAPAGRRAAGADAARRGGDPRQARARPVGLAGVLQGRVVDRLAEDLEVLEVVHLQPPRLDVALLGELVDRAHDVARLEVQEGLLRHVRVPLGHDGPGAGLRHVLHDPHDVAADQVGLERPGGVGVADDEREVRDAAEHHALVGHGVGRA